MRRIGLLLSLAFFSHASACSSTAPGAADSAPLADNSAPTAVDDHAETVEDTLLAIDVDVLLANDTDPDGDMLTLTSVQGATNCIATLNGTAIDVVPTADFFGEAAFEYTIDDGNGHSASATATVSVTSDFDTVAGQQIGPAGINCTTRSGYVGRKVAVDEAANIYGAMICGTGVVVVSSTDMGETYGVPTPFPLGVAVREVALQGGPDGIAYLAIVTQTPELLFSRTIDGGASWSPPTVLDTQINSQGLSMAVSGDSVFISVPIVTPPEEVNNYRVWRNTALGDAEGFMSTDISHQFVFHDIVVNDLNNDVWLVSDTPNMHLRQSVDGAMSFEEDVMPAPEGAAYYSDWAAGNGMLYVSGSSFGGGGGLDIALAVIDFSAPNTATPISGVSMTATQERSVTADPAGNVYVGIQTQNNEISVARALMGTLTIDETIVIGTGRYPSVAALPNSRGVAVIYSVDADVHIAIQMF